MYFYEEQYDQKKEANSNRNLRDVCNKVYAFAGPHRLGDEQLFEMSIIALE